MARSLGGLDALFGGLAEEKDNLDYALLPIEKVEPAQKQPRRIFDDEALSELASSIREHGMIQPLTVRRLQSGVYQIIAGERRWRAARVAGLTTVPARIVEADDREVIELALVENLQREDLNAIEEARGYLSLTEDFGLTQEETAERVGRSRSAVANSLRLLSLPPEVLDMVMTGALSAGHARAVLSIPDPKDQIAFAARVAGSGLSVRQAELLAKKYRAEPLPRQRSEAQDYIEDVERRLTEGLGRRVKIHTGRKKGKFEIEYYGDEDLETLIERLKSLFGGNDND